MNENESNYGTEVVNELIEDHFQKNAKKHIQSCVSELFGREHFICSDIYIKPIPTSVLNGKRFELRFEITNCSFDSGVI